MITLKIKQLHPEAKIPEYASEGSACFDLHVILERKTDNLCYIFPGETKAFRTGLSFEIPKGWFMPIFSRSGHGFKFDTRLSNCVGIIDSDYRGEVMIKLQNDSKFKIMVVNHMDRLAQAMLLPVEQVGFEFVTELEDTERGDGGFGSTGR